MGMSTPFKTLVEADKLIAASPTWKEKNAKTGDVKLVAALRMGGRVFQGLELVGRAQTSIRDAYVSFTLIYLPSNNRREAVRLCRLDWRPLTRHSNDHPNTPPDLLGNVDGTHHHSFSLNWSNKNNAPLKALPIAEEISPDYQTYNELLDGVGDLFRISNASSALPSPWPDGFL